VKNFIIIFIMVVGVGCSKGEAKRLEDSFFGRYELKIDEDTVKLVLLENGKGEGYRNGEKVDDGTWKMVGREWVACRNN